MSYPGGEQLNTVGSVTGSFWSRLRARQRSVVAPHRALWTIGIEFQSSEPDRPAVVVALLQARTPTANLLIASQVIEGSLALLRARGFHPAPGSCRALPVLEPSRLSPTTPPDWTGPRLELWFTAFTKEAKLEDPKLA